MAERAASIKLSLDSGEYLVELKRVGDANDKVAKDGKRKFDAMGKGIDAAKGSLGGLLQRAKDGIKTLGTLGGAFTAVNAAKQAVQLEARFRHLADAASDASGRMVTAAEVQQDVSRAAATTSRTSDELTTSFEGLMDATGDLDFARAAMAAIGTTATGTGKSVETLTGIAGTLNEKFGVTKDEIANALATVAGNTGKGKVQLAELAAVGDMLGANLLQAGLRGERGLKFLLGSLNAVEGEMGGVEKSAKGVGQILLNLGKGSELKSIAKDLGIDPSTLVNEKDAIARLMKILAFGKKGLGALKANFVGPEESKALRLLFADPFEQALGKAQASGLKGKDAIDQALRVLQDRIGKFGETATTAGTIQARAAREMEKPEAQLRKALDRLNQAFGQPEIIEAINELSKALPDLARIFGNFVSFAARNPLLSGMLGIGANVGSSFLSAAAREMLSAHMAGAAAQKTALEAAAPKFWGDNWMNTAGKAFGIAAAAYLAYKVGEQAIDNKAKEDAQTTGDLAAAEAAAAGTSGGVEAQRKRVENLRKALGAAVESRSGFGGTVEDIFSGWGGMVTGEQGASVKKDAQIRQAKRTLGEAQGRLKELMNAPPDAIDQAKQLPAGERPRVMLEPGTPRAIGEAVADALGGMTLSVVSRSGPGIAANPGTPSRGPLQVRPAAAGGGV